MHTQGLNITSPNEEGDGIVIFGKDNPNVLDNCTVDFKDIPSEYLDENISFVNGCVAVINDCTFSNGIKLALVGNGDYPDNDKHGIVTFNNCIFENFGRRGVEAQDGITVTLNKCVIYNWGIQDRFDVRSFASWAHSGAKIICNECVFIQDKFWQCSIKNMIIDIANHIGNDINDKCLSWKSFLPGVCKGLFSTDNGIVEAHNCTKNRWWIYLENQI